MKLNDVDWAGNQIRITCVKTETHGKTERWIPILPEIRVPLLEVVENAPEGADYVFHNLRKRTSTNHRGFWRGVNLRQNFLRIIKRAGVPKWERLFHNLRSSAHTDLANRFPEHVVCRWLGNTKAIAFEHYLQVTPEHMAAAASGESAIEKALQKALHQPAEMQRFAAQQGPGNEKTPCLQGVSSVQVAAEGFEQTQFSSLKSVYTPKRAAKSAAEMHTHTASFGNLVENGDPVLQELLDAWPDLSEGNRRAVAGLATALATAAGSPALHHRR